MHQYTHREMHTSVIKIPGESLQHTHTDEQIHILVIKFREGVIDTYTHTIHPTQRIEHVYINMDTHMLTFPQMHTSAIEILGDGHPSP